jgi:hypothetical protein
MPKTKQEIFLDLRTIRSFAGVRGRVKAAVAAQPRSVSLSQALAQTRNFKKANVTAK